MTGLCVLSFTWIEYMVCGIILEAVLCFCIEDGNVFSQAGETGDVVRGKVREGM